MEKEFNKRIVLAHLAKKLKKKIFDQQNFMLDPLISIADDTIETGLKVELTSWDKGFLAGYASAIHDAIRELLEAAKK